jgi:uncharacterized membrane protein
MLDVSCATTMHPQVQKALRRWAESGLVDSATADRLRAFEIAREKTSGLRWPVLLALAFGGLMLSAGVLLFVAAHWEDLSPAARFSLVLLVTGLFHGAGAAATGRFAALARVLHAAGTAALGAGIFLAGQIFHLQEHWPGGVMMWAAGAWIAYAVLRDWPQLILAAMLTPCWLLGEWIVATRRFSGEQQVESQGLLLLALTYFTLRTKEKDGPVERALMWIGGIALIPCTIFAAERWWYWQGPIVPVRLLILGWALGLGLPLALAYWRRGRAAWMNLVAALWVVLLGSMAAILHEQAMESLFKHFWRDFGLYLWLWIGALGLIWWGMHEGRKERVNLGVASFGITVLTFYFASVMDKLGRSVSLIGLGLLFLLCGWFLEKSRRRLLARLEALL